MKINFACCWNWLYLEKMEPIYELDDQFLRVFEQILEVNEEINVSYITENLQTTDKISSIT